MARAAATTTPALREADGARAGGIGWSLAGRLAYGLCQFALLIVIARLGTATDIGAFSLALAVTAPPMVFANLQLRALVATDVRGRFAWASYTKLRHTATWAALLVCVALAMGIHGGAALGAIAALAVAKAAETLSDLHYGVFQRRERMDRFGQSMILRGVLSVVAVAVVLGSTRSLAAALAAMAAVWIAVLVAFDAPHSRSLRAAAPAGAGHDGARALLLQALPLGGVFLLDSIHQNLPRYFVEGTLGNDALGVFTPMAYMVTIGSAVVFAMAAPQAPRLATDAERRDGRGLLVRLRWICTRTGGLGVVGVALAIIAGKPVLGAVFGPSYAAAADALVWIAVGGTLQFVMVPVMLALTAARALAVQLACYGAAVLGATAWCLFALPHGGLVAAAQAGAFGMACGLLASLAALATIVRRWSPPRQGGAA